jgi:hypothetical protein
MPSLSDKPETGQTTLEQKTLGGVKEIVMGAVCRFTSFGFGFV